jgi:hypothetical protein
MSIKRRTLQKRLDARLIHRALYTGALSAPVIAERNLFSS